MREQVIVSHDGYRSNEEKGATPDPLMGVFPLAFEMTSEIEAATLKFYLGRRKKYLGSPMLSALYGVWAAYAGDRALSARLMEDGYGRFLRRPILPDSRVPCGRVSTTAPCRPLLREPRRLLDGAAPWLPRAAAGYRVDPSSWPQRAIVLPKGWRAIEVDHFWVRRKTVSPSKRARVSVPF